MDTTVVFKKNLDAFNKKKTVIVNEGGQHSSKTYSILQLIVFLSQITKNKLYTIVGESIPFLKVGAMRQFLEILLNEKIFEDENWNQTERLYKMGTNLIEFKAYDSPTKALGAKRHFLFVNEAINIPYETYINLEGRTDNCTWLDYNPSFPFWVHEKVLNRSDSALIHSTYKDNPNLPQKIIDTIERYKEYDPMRWRVMGQGLMGSNEGLIFQNWGICDIYPESEKKFYGLDFGFTNDPSACVSVFKQGGELYVDEVFYGIGMTNKDIGDALMINGLKLRSDQLFADCAEPKSIDELYKRGWNVKPVSKGQDSIMKGIDLLKQYRINVSKRSINLIKELRSYQWLKDKDGKRINKPGGPDHCLDALRYAMTSMDSQLQTKYYIY